jgi:chromosome segregation ATPase
MARKRAKKAASRTAKAVEEDEEVEVAQLPEAKEIEDETPHGKTAPLATAYDSSDRTDKIREADAKAKHIDDKIAPYDASEKTVKMSKAEVERKFEGPKILTPKEQAPGRKFAGIGKDSFPAPKPEGKALKPVVPKPAKPDLEQRIVEKGMQIKTDEQLYEENQALMKALENQKKDMAIKEAELNSLRAVNRRLEVDVKAVTQYVHESVEEAENELNRLETVKEEMLKRDPMSRMVKLYDNPMTTVRGAQIYLDNLSQTIEEYRDQKRPEGVINAKIEERNKLLELLKLAKEGKIIVIRRYNYVLKKHEYENVNIDDIPKVRESMLIGKGARMGKGLRIKDLTDALEEKKKRDRERGIHKPDSDYLFKFKGVDVYLEDQDIIKSMAVEGAIAVQRNEELEKEVEVLKKSNRDGESIVEGYVKQRDEKIEQIKHKEQEKRLLEERIRALESDQRAIRDEGYKQGCQETSAKWIAVNQEAARKLDESEARCSGLRKQLTDAASEKIDMNVAEQRARQNLEAEHRKKIEQKDAEIRKEKERIAELEKRKGQLETSEESLNLEIDSLRKKTEELDSERQRLENEKSEFARERTELARKADEKERQGIAKGKEDAKEEIDRQVEAGKHPIYIRKSDFENEKNAKESLDNRLSELQGQMSELAKSLQAKEDEVERASEEKKALEKELATTKARLSGIESRTVTANDLNNAFPLRSEVQIVALMHSVGAEPDEHGNYNSSDLDKARRKLDKAMDKKQLSDDHKVDDDLREKAVGLGIVQEIQDGNVPKYIILNEAALDEIKDLTKKLKSEKDRAAKIRHDLENAQASQSAGSRKFNAQLEDKQKQINRIESNIEKKDDKIRELNLQLNQYQDEKDNLSSELEQAKRQIDLYETEKAGLQATVDSQNTLLSNQKAKLENASEQISDLEKAVRDRNSRVSELQADINRLDAEKKANETAINNLSLSNTLLEQERADAIKSRDAAKEREALIREKTGARIEEDKEKIAELEQHLETAARELAEQESELDSKEKALAEQLAENARQNQEIAGYAANIAALEQKLNSQEKALAKLQTENAAYEAEKQGLSAQTKAKEETIAQLLREVEREKEQKQQALERETRLTEESSGKLGKARFDISQKDAEIEILKNSEAELKEKLKQAAESEAKASQGIADLETAKSELESKLVAYETRIGEKDTRISALEQEKGKLEQDYAAEQESHKKTKEELEEADENFGRQDSEMKQIIEREKDAETAKKAALHNLAEAKKSNEDLNEKLEKSGQAVNEEKEKSKRLSELLDTEKGKNKELSDKFSAESEKLREEQEKAQRQDQQLSDYRKRFSASSEENKAELKKRSGYKGIVYVVKETFVKAGMKGKAAMIGAGLGAALLFSALGAYMFKGEPAREEVRVPDQESATQSGVIKDLIYTKLREEPFVLENADFDTLVHEFTRTYLGGSATDAQKKLISEKIIRPALGNDIYDRINECRREKRNYFIRLKAE